MKKYIYLDREKAKKGISLVYEVSEEKVENYKEYFEGNAVEFYGEDLPHFVTYLKETDSIRKATEEEKYANGFRTLSYNEVIIDGIITSYDTSTHYALDGKILDIEITLEELKTSLALYKYTQQESLPITTTNLTNLTASYNYLMLKDAMESYNEGLAIRWKNLDGTRVDITDEIYIEMESMKTQTRAHFQACFNAQEGIETYLDTLTSDELQEVVIAGLWTEYYI